MKGRLARRAHRSGAPGPGRPTDSPAVREALLNASCHILWTAGGLPTRTLRRTLHRSWARRGRWATICAS